MRRVKQIQDKKNESTVFGKILTLIVFISFISRIPLLLKDLPPFQFCDETIYQNEVLRMMNEGDLVAKEYRAGGFNIYPILFLAKILSFFLNDPLSSTQVLLVGRIFGVLVLHSISLVITYKIALMFTTQTKSLVVACLYGLSQFYFMQFWYPDTYLYFGVALLVYYLCKIQSGEITKSNFQKLGFAFGIALSTKWNALGLIIPIAFVVIPLILQKKQRRRNLSFTLQFILVGSSTALLLNPGLIVRFSNFQDGFLFNLQNYGNYPGIRWGGYLFYFAAIGINLFGLAVTPLIIRGLVLAARNWSQTYFLLAYPILIVFMLGDKQWVVHRNVSSIGPFLIPFIAIGLTSIKNYWPKINKIQSLLQRGLVGAIILLSALPYGYAFSGYLKEDTRIQATRWLMNASLPVTVYGNNEFCSGISPAQSAGFESLYDPELTKQLDAYVINSYWASPLSNRYLKKGIITPFDLNEVHFEQWNSTKLFGGFTRVSIQSTDAPEGYYIAKTFYGNGPDVIILRKVLNADKDTL